MIDLTTSYMGLKLKNPLVVSASPLGQDLNALCRMEEAGAAAVVLHSLFEEQIRLESEDLDRALDQGAESFPEALSLLPGHGRLQPRAGGLSGAHPRGEDDVGHPAHRQPQRRHPRAAGCGSPRRSRRPAPTHWS